MSESASSRIHRRLSEGWRTLASAAIALVAAVVLGVVASTFGLSIGDGLVGTLFVYLAAYLVITSVAFSRAAPEHLERWGRASKRGGFLARYVLGTEPGPGASLSIAAAALAVAVLWLPADNGATLPHPVRVAVAVTLAALAWASVVVSFAVTFHADNVRLGGQALELPDKADLRWSDYVYFAVAVMSTFGTTDIDVNDRSMRRTVTVNALIAFVFNTVIVATLVSALADL